MYKYGTQLSPSAVADIAELEHRFNCMVEIRRGQCIISGYNLVSEAGPLCTTGNAVDGIVADSTKPSAARIINGAAAIEMSILHSEVFLARLRFPTGTATASLCPAPTAQSCVEFLLHMSRNPHYRDAWVAQSNER